jgi:hypothetical protein
LFRENAIEFFNIMLYDSDILAKKFLNRITISSDKDSVETIQLSNNRP